MSTYMKKLLAAYAVSALVIFVVMASAASTAPEPLVKAGRLYVLVESCTSTTGKCFGELHKVTAVLDQQWIESVQCLDENCIKTGVSWKVNLARVYAIRQHQPGLAAD